MGKGDENRYIYETERDRTGKGLPLLVLLKEGLANF